MVRENLKEPDYDKQIEDLISGIMRMSSLTKGMSTSKEQELMQGKKAAFVVKGLKKRYIFEIEGAELKRTEDMTGVTTYCYSKSPQIFLQTVDRIIAGDVSAFQRAVQRGDLVMKGPQSFHDQLMWKKALDRLASLRKVYDSVS